MIGGYSDTLACLDCNQLGALGAAKRTAEQKAALQAQQAAQLAKKRARNQAANAARIERLNRTAPARLLRADGTLQIKDPRYVSTFNPASVGVSVKEANWQNYGAGAIADRKALRREARRAGRQFGLNPALYDAGLIAAKPVKRPKPAPRPVGAHLDNRAPWMDDAQAPVLPPPGGAGAQLPTYSGGSYGTTWQPGVVSDSYDAGEFSVDWRGDTYADPAAGAPSAGPIVLRVAGEFGDPFGGSSSWAPDTLATITNSGYSSGTYFDGATMPAGGVGEWNNYGLGSWLSDAFRGKGGPLAPIVSAAGMIPGVGSFVQGAGMLFQATQKPAKQKPPKFKPNQLAPAPPPTAPALAAPAGFTITPATALGLAAVAMLALRR